MAYTDEDLLKIVGDERKRSIGFGEGESSELTLSRTKALAYAKGEMADVPSLPNRSAATDSAIADAIETVLPDVLEIFTGGDDVATFVPQGEQDEDAAQQETDFVNHVVFVENEGFLALYTSMKDALTVRTGVLHWWWEEEEKQETRASLPAEMADMAPMHQAVAALGGQELEPEEQDDGSVDLNSKSLHGKVCLRAVPPEDFTVAADTVSLRDTTYCAMRDRPRVQDLIARGVDPDKARELKPYSQRNDTIELARDEAGEHNQPQVGGTEDLRIVEVRAHYIRLADDDGKLEVWCVVTDSEETMLLDKEKVGQIPFAALTPYMVPHRFYGESVADKLFEIQRIKTVLLRAGLDNIYFALNQRMEVSEAAASENTIPDLLRNEPGVPVRSKTGEAVRPISAGPLNVDTFAALEYVSVMAEGRSGIVRNAQGLNPDTLHDTAKGAIELLGMAQRRTRLIARIFAETGLKDLFLGIHCMLRDGYTADHAPAEAKLRNSWATIQPNTWPERCAMTVHIGVGSSGREHELMIATQRLEMMHNLATEQGGLQGPLLDAKNVYAALGDWERAAGSKKAEQYYSDPSDPNTPQPQPKPDPEMIKVQAQAATAKAVAEEQAKLERDKAIAKADTDRQAQDAKARADMDAAARNHELKMTQLAAELEMERQKLDVQLETQRQVEFIKARNHHEIGMAKVNASVSSVEAGGEPG